METTKRHIILVGLRRSGTTIFWRTLQQDDRLLCFDEPFRPKLRRYAAAGRNDRKQTLDEYLSRGSLIRSHWSTIQPYEELLEGFITHQEEYLRRLFDENRNVFMDLVRCHFKIDRLRRLFPDALIVHLVRDPRAWTTSHLRPYGDWLSDLPTGFFSYKGWFDFWSYESIAREIGLNGYAHEQLLQIWHLFTGRAEDSSPDLTIQFERFATHPKDVLKKLYSRLELDYAPLDFSAIHAPNQPHALENPRWDAAIARYLSKDTRTFLHSEFSKSDEPKTAASGQPSDQ